MKKDGNSNYKKINDKINLYHEDLEEYDEAAEVEPERNLYIAILDRAILDLRDKNIEIRRGAIDWITADDSSLQELVIPECTFNFVCATLDLDAERIRQKLLLSLKTEKKLNRKRRRVS